MLVTRGLGGSNLVTAGLGAIFVTVEAEWWVYQGPRQPDGYRRYSNTWTVKETNARIKRMQEIQDAI